MQGETRQISEKSAGATRDRIVAAAFELFLKHGYDGTGLSQILARSGLSKGAFYHHFPTKEAVYRDVVDMVFLKPLAQYDFDAIAARPLRDSRDALEDAYNAMPGHVGAMGVDLARYFALFFDALSRLEDFRDDVRRFYARLLTTLAARAYAERELAPKVADTHAGNILSQLEGRLFLAAVFGDAGLPAMHPPEAEPAAGERTAAEE